MNARTKAINNQRRVRDNSRTIGAILVEHGKLSAAAVGEIRQFAQEHGLMFGDAAVQMNLLTTQDIDLALARQFNSPILPSRADGGVADEVLAAHSPRDPAVEHLRALRTKLSLGWLGVLDRKIFAVTSAGRQDGRSWLAANLAMVFAQIGQRTLLIDADFRNSRQHQLFNLPGNIGLSALLTGRAGKETLHRVHPDLRLLVLPAGSSPPNPQELLLRPVFNFVLSRLAEQFDVVILDTPPAFESADAQILAARAGAAVMVARLHHTKHSQLKSVMDNFAHSGVNVIGSVINEH